jgi:hypothetical protein
MKTATGQRQDRIWGSPIRATSLGGRMILVLAVALVLGAWTQRSLQAAPPQPAAPGTGGFWTRITPASPEVAACGITSWVNPPGPEGVSISVNLRKNGVLKILDTPVGKLDFGSGNSAYAFCTDIYHQRPVGRTSCLDSAFFSDWRITWLVANYPPTPTDAVQQAARQAAVWYFTDGWSLDQSDPTLYNTYWDGLVRNAYNAILAAIPASPPPAYQPGNLAMIIEPATGSSFLPGQEQQAFTVRLTKGSSPLPGQTVTLTATVGTLNSTSGVTDNDGRVYFTLTNSQPITASVTATAMAILPAGSRFIDSLDPITWQRLVLGQNTQVTAQAQATRRWITADNVIVAHKFDDRNSDGIQQEDEPNLTGWQFTLTIVSGAGTTQATATTDSSGNAYFYNAVAGNGTYTLTETLQSGWFNTTPASQSRARTSGDPWSQWHADFGNARYSVIEVVKYLDVNGNGAWEAAAEPALPGWQFALDKWLGSDWGQYSGGTTGPDGRVIFTDLASGQYRAVERSDSQPGYAPTTPVEQVVSLGYPARATVQFGNRGTAALGDYVWWDFNHNGRQDPEELSIPGVDVVLTNSRVMTATTDASGHYEFANLIPGAYTVTIPSYEFAAGGALYGALASPQKAPGVPDGQNSVGDPIAHNAATGVGAGQVVTTADFGFQLPSGYTLAKKLNVPGAVRVHNPVTFTIQIANTGRSWITVLPLQDVYDVNYLAFVSASPAPSDPADDGTLDWNDLTTSFGADLAPGASFSVALTFTAKADTSRLPDGQTVNYAFVRSPQADPDGPGPSAAAETLSDQQASAGASAFDPTGLELTGFTAVRGPDGVRLQWQTVSELEILGFNLLRSRAATVPGDRVEPWTPVSGDLIFAEQSGSNRGGNYTYADPDVIPSESYRYVLEVVKLDGSVEQIALPQGLIPPAAPTGR